MKRDFFVVSVMLMVGASLLFAGGGSQTKTGTTSEIKLQINDYMTESPAIIKGIAAFEAETGVKVVVNDVASLTSAAVYAMDYTAGRAPDVVILGDWSVRGDILGNRLYPLNEFVTANDISESNQGFVQRFSNNGKLYAYMADTDVRLIYYNKAIFREAGLNPDTFPETWTEFMAVCEKVNHVRGNSQYAYAFYGSAADINTPIQWETLVRSLGGFAIDPDTNKILMGSPETVKAAEFYRDLIAKGYVPRSVLGYDGEALLNDFVEGNLAMIMNGSWQYSDMLKAGMKKEDIGYAYIPRADNGKFATIGGVWAFCISSATKNPQLAWKLIQHLFTDDYFRWEIESNSMVPTREKFFAQVQNDPFLSFIANYSLKYGQAELHSKYFLEDAQALSVSLNTAIGGGVDIKSSFDRISEELNKKHAE